MQRKLLLMLLTLLTTTIWASAQTQSQVYVLVHGAFQDSSFWSDITPLLEAEGHQVIAPDLPGHGADDTPTGDISLALYRETIIDIIETQTQPVVLVGHSFGGIVISEVAEARPELVDTLIYVAGYVPRNGDSLASLAELDLNNGFSETNFLLAEDYSYAYVLDDDFLTIFCGDCDDTQGERVFTNRQNEPLAPLNEPATVTAENFGTVDKVYIMTAQDNAASPQIQIFMLSQTLVDTVYALDTSHVPFITMPEQLASLLLQSVEQ